MESSYNNTSHNKDVQTRCDKERINRLMLNYVQTLDGSETCAWYAKNSTVNTAIMATVMDSTQQIVNVMIVDNEESINGIKLHNKDVVIVDNEERINGIKLHNNDNMVATTNKEEIDLHVCILDYYRTRNNYYGDTSTPINDDNLIHDTNLDLEKSLHHHKISERGSPPHHKISTSIPYRTPNNINTYRTSDNINTYRTSNNNINIKQEDFGMKNINNNVEVDFRIEPTPISKSQFPTTNPISTPKSATTIKDFTSKCTTTIKDFTSKSVTTIKDFTSNHSKKDSTNGNKNSTNNNCGNNKINDSKKGVCDVVSSSCNNNNNKNNNTSHSTSHSTGNVIASNDDDNNDDTYQGQVTNYNNKGDTPVLSGTNTTNNQN